MSLRRRPSRGVSRALKGADRARESGLSLLEVLVAMTLLVVSLGVIYGAIRQSGASVQASERVVRAVTHAESVLARLGEELPLEAGEGEFPDGFQWRVLVQPLAEAEADDTSAFAPLRVTVRMEWDDGGRIRSIELETIRLQAPQS